MSLAFPERIGSCAMMPNASSAFRFRNFREALAFVQRVGELAESEGHHPDISFGWGSRDRFSKHQQNQGTARERFHHG
jgi:pterin-4a-carbinolamine dehydratase